MSDEIFNLYDLKKWDYVQMAHPNPDEDAEQLYLLVDDPESMLARGELGDNAPCRVNIKPLGMDMAIAPMMTVPLSDLEIAPLPPKGEQYPLAAAKAIFDDLLPELPEWVRYAASPERGQYRGFAALHDKCDANMLLPNTYSSTTEGLQDFWIDYHEKVMDEITRLIMATSK